MPKRICVNVLPSTLYVENNFLKSREDIARNTRLDTTCYDTKE